MTTPSNGTHPTRGSTGQRPNLIVGAPHRSDVSPLIDVLAAHPEIGFVGTEDFSSVDGDADNFPLNTFMPEFTSDPECADAFAAIAKRLAGNVGWIGWHARQALEMPHVAVHLRQHLPDARLLLCLRDPAEAAYACFHAARDEMPASFEKAIDVCLTQMDEISRFDQRNGWDRFLATPPAVALLLQSGVYAPAIGRLFRLFPAGQIHVLAFESLVADPAAAIGAVFKFLDLDAAELSACVANWQAPASPAEPMLPETRQRLVDFYRDFNRDLAEFLNWRHDPWHAAAVSA